MSRKVVMVTGASSGIGKATALELAKMGADLVVVCRNQTKGEATMRQIARTGSAGSVEVLTADLMRLSDVRSLAKEFAANHSRLDVLVNNAGSVFTRYEETADSLERTMALNYFSPFLLTNLLLPMLKEGAPSRVVNVTSVAHFGGRLELDDINGKKSGGLFGLGSYGRSKLALVLFTYELARRVRDARISANCVHPGAVRTKIWLRSGAGAPFAFLASLFMKSPARGAETVLYLASSPEVDGVSGGYFVDKKPRRSSRASYDELLAKQLWSKSEEITGLSAG